MRTFFCLALVVLLSLTSLTGAAPDAHANPCKEGKALYKDDFSFFDPSWGNPSEQFQIDGGKLTIKPPVNQGWLALHQAGLYQDFVACISVSQNSSDPSYAYAGLLFWGIDYDNYYRLAADGTGRAWIERKQNGKFVTPVGSRTVDVLKKGEAFNVLSVHAKGGIVTAYLNGKQFTKFRGQPPQGGGRIGVSAFSPKDTVGSFVFKDFTILAAE